VALSVWKEIRNESKIPETMVWFLCCNDILYRIHLGPKSQPNVVHPDKLKPYVGENRPMWFS
jgi:hypothetical protein